MMHLRTCNQHLTDLTQMNAHPATGRKVMPLRDALLRG